MVSGREATLTDVLLHCVYQLHVKLRDKGHGVTFAPYKRQSHVHTHIIDALRYTPQNLEPHRQRLPAACFASP